MKQGYIKSIGNVIIITQFAASIVMGLNENIEAKITEKNNQKIQDRLDMARNEYSMLRENYEQRKKADEDPDRR
jgi:ABC-type transporter lipoprotein component MlaA